MLHCLLAELTSYSWSLFWKNKQTSESAVHAPAHYHEVTNWTSWHAYGFMYCIIMQTYLVSKITPALRFTLHCANFGCKGWLLYVPYLYFHSKWSNKGKRSILPLQENMQTLQACVLYSSLNFTRCLDCSQKVIFHLKETNKRLLSLLLVIYLFAPTELCD